MALSVQPVRGRKDLAAFIELPFQLHAREAAWTPPLKDDFERTLSDKNPLWRDGRGERELYLAREDGRVVGRVIAHVHHASNARHGEKAGFFGLLETPPGRLDVAEALLSRAASFARERGLAELRGPYELTITQCIGAVVAGFDEPAAFSQSWCAPHVHLQLESLGFEPCYRAVTLRQDDMASVNADALLGEKQRAWLARPDVTLRGWNMDRFEADLDAAITLLHEGFSENFGFVPMSPEEVAFMAGPMKRVVRPELTVFLELAGEPVGVGMALPDFNVLFRRMNGSLWPLGWATFLLGAPRLDAAVLQFMATSPKLQNLGLMRVIAHEMVKRLQGAGIRTFDGTWIGEPNVKSLAQAKALGMREKHRLTLYRKAL
ncbi:MAG: hypothetical protein RL653_2124 [Pseudomonadota bacterium]|jgi:GNAT superfamily N-acetyltransferase